MLAIILIVVFSGAVGAYNYFWASNPIKDGLRNTMLALSLGIVFALPIGEWQTEYIEDTEPITGRMVYVPSCEHHVEEGGHPTYITPKYTSWLACCFDDEDKFIQYCSECYTREEAINMYIAQR